MHNILRKRDSIHKTNYRRTNYRLKALKLFLQNAPSYIFARILNTPKKYAFPQKFENLENMTSFD